MENILICKMCFDICTDEVCSMVRDGNKVALTRLILLSLYQTVKTSSLTTNRTSKLIYNIIFHRTLKKIGSRIPSMMSRVGKFSLCIFFNFIDAYLVKNVNLIKYLIFILHISTKWHPTLHF